jgi:inner membrane protein
MFVLAHMGIGWKIAKPLSGATEQQGLPMRWVLLGAILPDLIDKPVYYAASWITGLSGADIGLISGTRTFGHTALLLLVVLGLGFFSKSRAVAAIALGIATHILLDQLGDSIRAVMIAKGVRFDWDSPKLAGLLWPAMGNRFPVLPYENAAGHLSTVLRPHILVGEIVGGLILWSEWRKRKLKLTTK